MRPMNHGLIIRRKERMTEHEYHGYTLTWVPGRGTLAKQVNGDEIKFFTCISKAKEYIDNRGKR